MEKLKNISKTDRYYFFNTVRNELFGGKLKQMQVDGLNIILDAWETNLRGKDLRRLAYILATVYHETAKTFQPIAEYGKGRRYKYGQPDAITGKTYYGRGYVQLTWKYNYEKMAVVCGCDLVNNPEFALFPNVAVKILLYGMFNGSFTGKKLSDYFNINTEDWINARRIINGTDKATLIAEYAKEFYAGLVNTV